MSSKTAQWNVKKARELWDAGMCQRDIAEACRITKHQLHGYADRHHWPKREIDKARAKRVKPRIKPIAAPVTRYEGGPTLPPLPSLTYLD